MKKGSRRYNQRRSLMTDLNMTPFIDVILVLLVIFMITAPLMQTQIPLKLPKTSAPSMDLQKNPLVISLTVEGDVFVGDEKVKEKNAVACLQSREIPLNEIVYLRADRDLAYGRVAEIMGDLRSAGYTQVAFITEEAGSKKFQRTDGFSKSEIREGRLKKRKAHFSGRGKKSEDVQQDAQKEGGRFEQSRLEGKIAKSSPSQFRRRDGSLARRVLERKEKG